MDSIKEFHYQECDLKGSSSLIDDCKNHYVYLNNLKCESDLEIILNGVNQNLTDIEIVKNLSNVTCDNLYSIINGIKCVRNQVGINEELVFQKYFYHLLNKLGFDFEKMVNCSKAHIKAEKYADINSLLMQTIEMFVKWCKQRNFDVIDILLS